MFCLQVLEELTLRDKLDVLLVCGGERVFMLTVCRDSLSRVMVLPSIQTVKNDLRCRKADTGKEKQVNLWRTSTRSQSCPLNLR